MNNNHSRTNCQRRSTFAIHSAALGALMLLPLGATGQQAPAEQQSTPERQSSAENQSPAAAHAPRDYSQSTIVTRMLAFDKRHDGKLTKDEVTDWRLHRLFDQADANKDGIVTKEELMALAAKIDAQTPARGRGFFGAGPGGPEDGAGGPGGPGGGPRGRGGFDGGPGGPGGGPGGPGGFGAPSGPGPGGDEGPHVDWAGKAASLDLSTLPPASNKKNLTFAKDIQPLFEASCVRCHGRQRARGDLRLDSLAGILKGGEDGKMVIPGQGKTSPLVIAISRIDPETAMPPTRRPGQGGGPGAMLASQLLRQGDKNSDKKLSKAEFIALADTWFDKLDPAHHDKLTRDQFVAGFHNVMGQPGRREGAGFHGGPGGQPGGGPGGPPDGGPGGPPQGGPDNQRPPAPGAPDRPDGPPGNNPQGRPEQGGPGAPGGRGAPGAPGRQRGFNRFGPAMFIAPALFDAADTNHDGSLTREEWKQSFAKWFDEWDKTKSGALAQAQLASGLNSVLPPPNFGPGGFGPGGPGQGGPGQGGPRQLPPRGQGGPGGGPGGPGGGPGGPAGGPDQGGPGQAGPPPQDQPGPQNRRAPQGQAGGFGQGGAGGFGRGGFGPGGGPGGQAPKPLTAEQVGLVRAWIDQGAK